MNELTEEEKSVIIFIMGGIPTVDIKHLLFPHAPSRSLQPFRYVEKTIIKKLRGDK